MVSTCFHDGCPQHSTTMIISQLLARVPPARTNSSASGGNFPGSKSAWRWSRTPARGALFWANYKRKDLLSTWSLKSKALTFVSIMVLISFDMFWWFWNSVPFGCLKRALPGPVPSSLAVPGLGRQTTPLGSVATGNFMGWCLSLSWGGWHMTGKICKVVVGVGDIIIECILAAFLQFMGHLQHRHLISLTWTWLRMLCWLPSKHLDTPAVQHVPGLVEHVWWRLCCEKIGRADEKWPIDFADACGMVTVRFASSHAIWVEWLSVRACQGRDKTSAVLCCRIWAQHSTTHIQTTGHPAANISTPRNLQFPQSNLRLVWLVDEVFYFDWQLGAMAATGRWQGFAGCCGTLNWMIFRMAGVNQNLVKAAEFIVDCGRYYINSERQAYAPCAWIHMIRFGHCKPLFAKDVLTKIWDCDCCQIRLPDDTCDSCRCQYVFFELCFWWPAPQGPMPRKTPGCNAVGVKSRCSSLLIVAHMTHLLFRG